MLRDPIERVISHYYYFKHVLNNKLANEYSLEEFSKLDRFSNMQTHYITGDDPNLEKAINNLKTFAFFGITEMFKESLFLMKNTFGWETIDYSRGNVNNKKLKKESIPKETIEQIEKANLIDIQLYQWAKENLKNRIETLDKKSKIELATWVKSFKP